MRPGPRPPVYVSLALRERLRALAVEGSPYEMCGVVRAVERGGGFDIEGVAVARNVARDRIGGFRLRRRDARAAAAPWLSRPGRWWGVFHTHTLTDATPSAHDVAMMRAWRGVHVIVATDGSIRAFISRRRVVEARVLT